MRSTLSPQVRLRSSSNLLPATRVAPSTGSRKRIVAGAFSAAAVATVFAGFGSGGNAAVAGQPALAPAAAVGNLTLPPVSFPVANLVAAPVQAASYVKPAHLAVPASVSVKNAPTGAAVVTAHDRSAVSTMATSLRRLRTCESGGNYREASGNGYYGAYQFDLTTWHSLGLKGYPQNASRQLQDVAVTRLASRRGWGPWPVCSYVAGLR